jgi:4-hydroxybenzoyl-CoA thioesterase
VNNRHRDTDFGGADMDVFFITKRVSWGDCDPAGILYTPRVFDYCTEAIERWYAGPMGVDWPTMNRRDNMGSPTVHAECDYLVPMVPGLELEVRVLVTRLGRSSIDFAIEGAAATGGGIHFRARYTACITDFAQGKAVAIPEPLRRRIEAYGNLPSA